MSKGTGARRSSAHSDLKRRLLLAVSVSALTTAAPSLGIYGYGGRARAQALDAGCTDQNGDSNADGGDTVTCVAPPNPIEDVITTVDDLTVVIGDGVTATTISSNAAATTAGVSMSGGGDQRLEITAGDRVEGDANSNAVDISSSSGSVVVINLGAIYSSGGRGVNASVGAGGTDLTIESDGSIEGTHGIYATSYGSGAVSVSANDVTGHSGQGINVSADTTVTGVTVDVAGAVTGQANGIGVGSVGTGEVVITLASGASATGQTGAGITLTTYGNATVQGSGTVLGASRGINAIAAGADITVDGLDSVTGQGGDGVYGLSNGGNITISDIGTVLGTGGDGIDVNSGAGDISIQGVGLTGGITGTGAYDTGILAQSTSGTIDIGGTTAVGDVTGSETGIYARSNAGGDITITSTGTVTGGVGISLYTESQTADFQVNANDVYSTVGAGIVTYNQQGTAQATGSISVTGEVSGRNQGIATFANGNTSTTITLGSSATVTGRSQSGIRSVSSYDGADITVQGASSTGAGTVTGNQIGMWLQADFAADITVQDLVSVTGQNNDGILVRSNRTGAVTISNVGTVLGTGGEGIYVRANGGDVSIQGVGLTGGVTGTSGNGITVTNSTGAVDIGGTVAVGDVTGSSYGIRAQSTSGDVTVASTGTVDGGTRMGVIAWSTGGGDVDVDVANASGNTIGIAAYGTGGNGNVTVTSASASGNSSGISTTASGTGTLTVNAGDAYATVGHGILASHSGSGDISVSASGTVTSLGLDGILASHTGTGGLSVAADGAVTGGRRGITAQQTGASGAEIVIDLGASANVTGQSAEGIQATSSGTGTVTVSGASGGSVTGATRGIYASSAGTAVTVDGLGSVTGQAGDAVRARSNGGTITISDVDTILGIGGSGIDARSTGGDISIQGVGLTGGIGGTSGAGITAISGAGAIDIGSVTAIGGATGLSTGIYAQGGGDITITSAGVIEGGSFGVYAQNTGSGTTAIDVYSASGGLGTGIYVTTGATSGDISVTASSAAIGSDFGIYAVNNGIGAVTVNAGRASGSSAAGIAAINTGSATDISVTATGDVTGGTYGVLAANYGLGSTTVSAADATGGSVGILAYNAFGSGGLTVTSTGTVTGTTGTGINAISAGDGALTVSAASVIGGAYDGIYVNQSPGGTSTSVTATGPVTGNYSGVYVVHYGMDAATVSVGDATGTTYAGIYVYSSTNSTGLTITSTGTVSGGVDGIVGLHYGTGNVTVQAKTVTATANDGISVFNDVTGGATSITATAAVTGGDEGIQATTYGTGGLNITALGTVTGGDRGVRAVSYGSGSVTISLAGVSGGTHGVEVYNASTDATTITVSGAISGAAGEGIYTATAGGATITVASGASVSGTGAAIETDSTGGGGNAVSDTVTLEAGASLSGHLLLHAGADTFNDASGDFTTALGGAGTDTLNFSGTGRTVSGSNGGTDAIQEFEIFNFNAGGFTLAGTHQALDEANFNTGTNSLTGTLEAAEVTIADGATLAAADATSVTGNLTNAGTLAIGNSPGTVTINGDFTQSSTGDLPIEIDGSDFDQLIVTGDVTLDGNLGVTFLSGGISGTATRIIIDGGGALAGSFASVDGSNSLLITNSVSFDTANSDVLLTTTVNSAASVASLTPNQIAAGDNLIGQLADTGVNPGLAALALAIGSEADPEALAARLLELGPEVTDLGLKFLTMAQDRFTRQMLDRSIAPTGTGDEGIQVWGSVAGAGVSQDGGSNYSDFNGKMFQLAAGMTDIPLGGAGSGVTAGVAAGFSNFSGETPNGILDGSVLGDKTDANAFHAGASLAVEDLTVAGVDLDAKTGFSFASGKQDIEMNLTHPVSGSDLKQLGTADFTNLGWSARVTANGTNGEAWPVKPFLELGVTRTQQDSFSLSSGTATSLDVEGFDAVRGSVGLGLSFDHQLSSATGLSARVGGTKYFGDTQNVIDARFADTSSGSTFATAGKDVDWQARFEAGVNHRFDNGLNLDAQVFGETGSLTSVGAGVTLSIRF